MSIRKTRQTGDIDQPLPQSLLELQQLALGMFLFWDVLADDYQSQELIENAALADWARKHKVNRLSAIEALVMIKERFINEPWAHYLHCRDFRGEGWANMLAFNPLSNQDLLEQINAILKSRPFKEGIRND